MTMTKLLTNCGPNSYLDKRKQKTEQNLSCSDFDEIIVFTRIFSGLIFFNIYICDFFCDSNDLHIASYNGHLILFFLSSYFFILSLSNLEGFLKTVLNLNKSS